MENTAFLRDVIISYFPDSIFSNHPELKDPVSSLIEQAINKEIEVDQAKTQVVSLTGDAQALERLKEILAMKPDPIAYSISPEEQNGTRRKSRAWNSYEDQRLLFAIFKYGIESWTAISKFVGNGRTRSQCSQRWYRGLNPSISKEHWTEKEERKLIELVKVHGEKSWTLIANKMGNRNDVQCRYRYHQLQKEDHEAFSQHQQNNQFVPNYSQMQMTPLPAIPNVPAFSNIGVSYMQNVPLGNIFIPPFQGGQISNVQVSQNPSIQQSPPFDSQATLQPLPGTPNPLPIQNSMSPDDRSPQIHHPYQNQNLQNELPNEQIEGQKAELPHLGQEQYNVILPQLIQTIPPNTWVSPVNQIQYAASPIQVQVKVEQPPYNPSISVPIYTDSTTQYVSPLVLSPSFSSLQNSPIMIAVAPQKPNHTIGIFGSKDDRPFMPRLGEPEQAQQRLQAPSINPSLYSVF